MGPVDSSDEVFAGVDRSGVTFTDSAGYRVLVTALGASYPRWTDENGTNVEQLAAVAIAALEAAGMLEPQVFWSAAARRWACHASSSAAYRCMYDGTVCTSSTRRGAALG